MRLQQDDSLLLGDPMTGTLFVLNVVGGTALALGLLALGGIGLSATAFVFLLSRRAVRHPVVRRPLVAVNVWSHVGTVGDVAPRPGDDELAELAALADGTLSPTRRVELEARVAASPKLQEILERQRQAVLAVRSLEAEDVPASLRIAVEEQRRATGRRRALGRRLWPGMGLVGAAATAGIVAAVVLVGGPGGPSVAKAAQLAVQTATAPAPAPAGSARLAIAVEGVPFPDYAQTYGWRATGARRGRVDGRDATVVFYRKGGARVGYVIVSGEGLEPPSGGEATVVDGVRYQTLQLDGRPAVTWRRGGHTCVLLGEASPSELLALARYEPS